MRGKLICNKLFFVNFFFHDDFHQSLQTIKNNNQKLSKMLLMNLTEEKNLTGAVLLIDRGFPGYLFVVMY